MKNLFHKKIVREAGAGYLFMAPAIIVMGIFLILPLVYAIFLSFHKVRILGLLSYKWIGVKNFIRWAGDERVWIALKNTAEYVAIVVPIQTILALVLALILNSSIKGKNWFLIIFFLPTVTSSIGHWSLVIGHRKKKVNYQYKLLSMTQLRVTIEKHLPNPIPNPIPSDDP